MFGKRRQYPPVEFFAAVTEAERRRPKPAFGPKLIDPESGDYEVASGPLADISNVRVGGVLWNKVASNPRVGEWAPNLAAGTFQLGAPTLGGEVRCDAKLD